MINRALSRVVLGVTAAATSFAGFPATTHAGGCVDISETTTKLVQTGDYRMELVCSVANTNTLRPLNPSTTEGRGYQLADGRILWLTEADWWELMDKAVEDEAWRKENHDLLVAVGILSCHFELVPTIETVDVTRQYRFCPPTWDPYERPL